MSSNFYAIPSCFKPDIFEILLKKWKKESYLKQSLCVILLTVFDANVIYQ
ncbi:hypothetical protein Pedsa_0642 [Pseudopedobacter saltans DSM 12145]|uniref:Uncharacterized protein n=1 Tax=Pseudopedobacter saltans (strain ATCC 51119 / DSM 12145 / JCM 21818 / CCUG 39354 / LMG 10337 / NBRC 100064 / NCIMB 13643) TaxID=762903 RepID=F0S7Z7_PSESL|nr:hypothetical protein Pedsa_0642 [Pseudopedobacter saltans DSM 12145]